MRITLRIFLVFIVLFYLLSTASAQINGNISYENNSRKYIESNEHNLTNQSYNIRVVLDHIFISKKNSSLEISEIVVFRNEGQEIYYSKDNHTFFAISTPSGAKNLETQVMECCLVQEEGTVYMDPMRSIMPGGNFEMQISYTLYPQSQEYVFNKSAMYNTTSLSMFINKKSGINFDGSYETLTLKGNEYSVVAFNDMKIGETVGIPVKLTEKSDYLYAAVGLFSLFSIGLVYRFKKKIFKKRREKYTLEELELEKRKIFQAIRGFEKHAVTEKSEEYKKLMDEYRQKAIQVFIKIDKIKFNQGSIEYPNQEAKREL